MNDALEDQLAEARTQVDNLQRDYQAQADLLTEASTNLDSLRGEVALLTAEIDTLKAERDDATKRQSVTTDASHALQTRITELQASQADFDTPRPDRGRPRRRLHRHHAAGPRHPRRRSTQAADLHAQFAAITDPAAQTVFWRKLTPEQQALILKHQA